MIQTQSLRMALSVILLAAALTDKHTAYAQQSTPPAPQFGDLPTLRDEQYKTACGPIACYVALHSLGKTTSLDDIVNRCGWKPNTFTTLEAMRAALHLTGGIECIAARITPQELCRLVKDDETVVILPVRKDTEKTDHAFCAVETKDDGQVIRIIDYPQINRNMMIGELTQMWDGPALIVRISTIRRVLRNVLGLLMPIATVIVLLYSATKWIRGHYKGQVCLNDPSQADLESE